MVKAIARAGHEIGNHTYTHPHLNKMAKEEIARELLKTHRLIQELTGQTATLFRPPFGEYNNKVIETATGCVIPHIIWDIDSLTGRISPPPPCWNGSKNSYGPSDHSLS